MPGNPSEKTKQIPKSSDPTLRRRFVEALERGDNASVAAGILGIGLSTFYKWRARYQELGVSWLECKQATKVKRLPGKTALETHEQIAKLSLENPKWGAARVAKEISAQHGITMATGTVHAILARQGLSDRQGRAKALYLRYRDEKRSDKKYDFNRDQRDCLATISPFAAWKRGQASEPGRQLIQQVVPIAHTSPIGNAMLMVIVDACDQRAFAKFNDRRSENPEGDFLREVVAWYKAQGMTVREVVTNNGYQYFGSYWGIAYQRVLDELQIQPRFDTFSSAGLRLNPLVKDVWRDLRTYLFKERRQDAIRARESHAALNSMIREFLDESFGDG